MAGPLIKSLPLFWMCEVYVLMREPLGMDTKLDWCGDALCGMGVIRSPRRLISNGLGAVGWGGGALLAHASLPRTMTELVETGIASQVKRLWRRVRIKGAGRTL